MSVEVHGNTLGIKRLNVSAGGKRVLMWKGGGGGGRFERERKSGLAQMYKDTAYLSALGAINLQYRGKMENFECGDYMGLLLCSANSEQLPEQRN